MDILLTEIRKANFEKFLKDILSQKDENGKALEIYDINAVERQSSWWTELNDAVDYVFSLSPEDISLQMRLRGSKDSAYFVVNPFTQKFCFLKVESYKSEYLEDLVKKTASKYEIHEVNMVKELYNKPTKNLLISPLGRGEISD